MESIHRGPQSVVFRPQRGVLAFPIRIRHTRTLRHVPYRHKIRPAPTRSCWPGR
jgi:hypothetical protein